jgi:YfiH family protein
MSGFRTADWTAPPGVHAIVTTRIGGVSTGAKASFNLAAHVGDDPAAVAENRRRLRAALDLPAEPLWLRQVHGTAVVVHDGTAPREPEADAAVTFDPGRVLAVLTADCLPVVLASRDGRRLGVAHAGWRGLAGGVLEATVAALGVPGDDLVAWLGPAISRAAFEVGDEVRAAFVDVDPATATAFVANARGRWQADLYALARRRLGCLGVREISGGGDCTYALAEAWFSFRRDRDCGRMATVAWLAPR